MREGRWRWREAWNWAGEIGGWRMYFLLGLRHSSAMAQALLQGVRSMRESSTYQATVREGLQKGLVQGAIATEARKLLVRLGSNNWAGPAPVHKQR